MSLSVWPTSMKAARRIRYCCRKPDTERADFVLIQEPYTSFTIDLESSQNGTLRTIHTARGETSKSDHVQCAGSRRDRQNPKAYKAPGQPHADFIPLIAECPDGLQFQLLNIYDVGPKSSLRTAESVWGSYLSTPFSSKTPQQSSQLGNSTCTTSCGSTSCRQPKSGSSPSSWPTGLRAITFF